MVSAIIKSVNCFNGTIERITRGRPQKSLQSGDIGVLIVRTQAVGDFLLSLPAIKSISATFPETKTLLLTYGSTASVDSAKLCNYLGGNFIWRDLIPKSIIHDSIVCLPNLKNLLKMRRDLSETFKNIPRSYLIGENIKIGLGITKKILMLRFLGYRGIIYGTKFRACPQLFADVQIRPFKVEHHLVAMLRTVSECPLVSKQASKSPDISISLGPSEEKIVHEVLGRADGNARPYVVIAPGSILEFKRWPTENFVAVARNILIKYDLTIIISGSKSEESSCSKFFNSLVQNESYKGRVHNFCGSTSVVELAALLKLSVFLLANDGGACHIAAAVGCPVISIANGAEPANSVEPWGFQHLTARYVTECSPCYCFTKCPLGTKECVNNVSVELVESKIQKVVMGRYLNTQI